jgi:hypothetical protein
MKGKTNGDIRRSPVGIGTFGSHGHELYCVLPFPFASSVAFNN